MAQHRRQAVVVTDGADLEPLQLIHSIPGRVRIHVPGWGNLDCAAFERRLSLMPGVGYAHANPLTRNVLIQFDPSSRSTEGLLRMVETTLRGSPSRPRKPLASGKPARSLSQPNAAGVLRWYKPLAVRARHAPAIISLILSLVTCSSPLGVVRVALETLQLCGELITSATA